MKLLYHKQKQYVIINYANIPLELKLILILKFGWYDGIPAEVDRGDVTTLLPDIWDLMGAQVWKLFGGKGQKDSWNTADVFMVKNGADKKF